MTFVALRSRHTCLFALIDDASAGCSIAYYELHPRLVSGSCATGSHHGGSTTLIGLLFIMLRNLSGSSAATTLTFRRGGALCSLCCATRRFNDSLSVLMATWSEYDLTRHAFLVNHLFLRHFLFPYNAILFINTALPMSLHAHCTRALLGAITVLPMIVLLFTSYIS